MFAANASLRLASISTFCIGDSFRAIKCFSACNKSTTFQKPTLYPTCVASNALVAEITACS